MAMLNSEQIPDFVEQLRGLKSEEGENTEYDRALVEVLQFATGLPDKRAAYMALGIKDPEAKPVLTVAQVWEALSSAPRSLSDRPLLMLVNGWYHYIAEVACDPDAVEQAEPGWCPFLIPGDEFDSRIDHLGNAR